jgi:exodeoxyribonuclease X
MRLINKGGAKLKISVIDTETTGMEEQDQVVEFAAVTLRNDGPDCSWRIDRTYTTLVRPTVPVSVGARATHHITDAELAGARPMDQLTRDLEDIAPPSARGGSVFIAAHNAEFDIRMLRQSGVPDSILSAPKICTWRCALHLCPDAPSHSNQVLRYYLGVEVPPIDGPPHRALPDAIVTASVLLWMLDQGKTPAELVALTAAPALLNTLRFGKHRGQRWADVESDYLRWILRQDFGADEKHTAAYWLRERQRPVLSNLGQKDLSV